MKRNIQSVVSPCYGSVKKVLVREDSYVYEWEALVIIEGKENREVEVAVGVSGDITSLPVTVGQEVTPETIVTIVEDDGVISGSD